MLLTSLHLFRPQAPFSIHPGTGYRLPCQESPSDPIYDAASCDSGNKTHGRIKASQAVFSPAFHAQIGHVRSPHSASRRAGFVFIPGSLRQPSRLLIQVLIDSRSPRNAYFPRICRYNMLSSIAEKSGRIKLPSMHYQSIQLCVETYIHTYFYMPNYLVSAQQ